MSVKSSLISANSPFLIRSTSLGGSGEKDGDRSSCCDTWLSIGKFGTTSAIGASVIDDSSGAGTVFGSKEKRASDCADGKLPSDRRGPPSRGETINMAMIRGS